MANSQCFQTDIPPGKDFQSQTTIQSEKVSMTTQTDSAQMQDSQVQVNLERANIATENQQIQAIKTEISPNILMPNIPNSVNPSSSKKRKLSSARTATSTQDDFSTVDPSILNSEVYKVYCQNEDPKKAMKHIKNMKTCLSFESKSFSQYRKKKTGKKAAKKI